MINAGFSPSGAFSSSSLRTYQLLAITGKVLKSIFEIEKEILISGSANDTYCFLNEIKEEQRILIGENARNKVLAYHTAAHRAKELENYYKEALCQLPVQTETQKKVR